MSEGHNAVALGYSRVVSMERFVEDMESRESLILLNFKVVACASREILNDIQGFDSSTHVDLLRLETQQSSRPRLPSIPQEARGL